MRGVVRVQAWESQGWGFKSSGLGSTAAQSETSLKGSGGVRSQKLSQPCEALVGVVIFAVIKTLYNPSEERGGVGCATCQARLCGSTLRWTEVHAAGKLLI